MCLFKALDYYALTHGRPQAPILTFLKDTRSPALGLARLNATWEKRMQCAPGKRTHRGARMHETKTYIEAS